MVTFHWSMFLVLSAVQDIRSLKCDVGKYPIFVPSGNYILEVTQSGADQPEHVPNTAKAEQCQQLCDSFSKYECRSFSMSPVQEQCILYPVTDTDSGVSKQAQSAMTYYKGVCSTTPNLDKCDSLIERVDLAFLVDGSGSICDNDPSKSEQDGIATCNNWISLKRFLQEIVSNLDIGESRTRIALITFANDAELIFDFNRYTNLADLNQAFARLVYPGGNTYTDKALNLLRIKLFGQSNTDRYNIAFVITDGKATDQNNTRQEAKRIQEAGTIMYAVGITNSIDEQSLKDLSSYPHKLNRNYFRSLNFDTLGPVVAELLSASCIKPNPKLYSTTAQPRKETVTPVIGLSEQFLQHPGYIILLMMGVVVVVLFTTAIILLCYY